MPEITVYASDGTAGQTISLRDDVFGGKPNVALLHQAITRQLANRRQGSHDTLTRGEVNRTTKKVWRQKGTGRARQGSRKGPHWTGGGVAFGPHPRSHRVGFPRKMVAASIRSALAAKSADNQIVLVEALTMDRPSTKQLKQLLSTIAPGRKVLVMLDGPQPAVQLSARNLQEVTTATVDNINAYDLLRHDRLVLSVAAARRLEERFAKPEETEAKTASATSDEAETSTALEDAQEE
jgi:large subunit ribosomal protein L4